MLGGDPLASAGWLLKSVVKTSRMRCENLFISYFSMVILHWKHRGKAIAGFVIPEPWRIPTECGFPWSSGSSPRSHGAYDNEFHHTWCFRTGRPRPHPRPRVAICRRGLMVHQLDVSDDVVNSFQSSCSGHSLLDQVRRPQSQRIENHRNAAEAHRGRCNHRAKQNTKERE